jgi:hypothetical protein
MMRIWASLLTGTGLDYPGVSSGMQTGQNHCPVRLCDEVNQVRKSVQNGPSQLPMDERIHEGLFRNLLKSMVNRR